MAQRKRQEATTLAVLAELVGARMTGDPSTRIVGVAPIDNADEGEITFLANPKHQEKLANCRASAVIVPPSLAGTIEKPLLLADNPYLAFAKILKHFYERPSAPQGVHEKADVHPDASIGDDVTISSGCVIGAGSVIGKGSCLHPNVVVYQDVQIGEDCLIHANVTIRERCVLGDRVILQPGVTIGSDGFGYVPDGNRHYKIPQIGRVILEDDVEVGSSSCIDRGTMGDTRIGRGTKVDNLIQIAHNCQVGNDCILIAQMGLAGSVKIGDHCTISGQVAIKDHVTLGNNVTVAGKSGVTSDVAAQQVVAGFPAMPHKDWLRANMTFPKLPEMRNELRQLKKQVKELIQKTDEDE
ncbi:MAG: UDP-3-O-(3-hydroxymyristoyl)glucosamine N-acyltransferase [Deltaproteobacteria bacterium]|jgi:UDP-3-O-[3-hydroxymyristoyl] glucosamine N-acyltransferase|nr:UDP-3-O-(3-hydroxymyristoyl)glucosamine N-acyltransferase [Deltaproteobacteria bacterium]